MIDNPDYKGVWKPRRIPNPEYFVADSVSVAPMAGIAVEVWTTNAGIHFDNFLVARTLEEALDYAEKTFRPKAEAQKAAETAAEHARKLEAAERKVKEGGALNWLQGQYMKARAFVLAAPPQTLAMVIGAPLVGLLSLLWLISSSPSKPRRPRGTSTEAAPEGEAAGSAGAGGEEPAASTTDADADE
jgi:hypothetical protein